MQSSFLVLVVAVLAYASAQSMCGCPQNCQSTNMPCTATSQCQQSVGPSCFCQKSASTSYGQCCNAPRAQAQIPQMPIYQPQPQPQYQMPAPVYQPAPMPVYQPAPMPAYQPQPMATGGCPAPYQATNQGCNAAAGIGCQQAGCVCNAQTNTCCKTPQSQCCPSGTQSTGQSCSSQCNQQPGCQCNQQTNTCCAGRTSPYFKK